MNNRMTAKTARQILATAHASWFATKNKDEADAALEASLLDTGLLDGDDCIELIELEGTTIRVVTESGYATELDAYGNTIIGLAD